MELLGTKRIRTTAYHPIANGIVEHFHRQLKASLKAQQHQNHWAEALLTVLLGIWMAVKQDVGSSTAELVYSTTLRLPGEFVDAFLDPSTADPANYVTRLNLLMQHVQASLVHMQPSRREHIDKSRFTGTHALIRHDA